MIEGCAAPGDAWRRQAGKVAFGEMPTVDDAGDGAAAAAADSDDSGLDPYWRI